ncbi:MAG TPA: SCP2 sterol-binding domain-containing protein [Candidatus Lokiarchaeia archaeon]|nr:SCP2 sterol-binding domain-containing protein [Candidatus Lokiarchaeia archaeon]
MDKDDEERFFGTFQSIIESVLAEKRKNKKWENPLKNFNAIVQFRLHISKDDFFYCHLTAKDGNYDLQLGPVDKYDLELAATPEDLMLFTNKTYSTANMIMQKNQWGQKRLQIKKGGRNIGKLLALSKILVLE